jgi:biopolymer transport protein TolQ
MAAAQPGMAELFLEADIIVQATLAVLVGMSVSCWVIIFNKVKVLRFASGESQDFLDLFWNSTRLDQVYEQVQSYPRSPVAQVFRAGYIELAKLTSKDRQRGNKEGVDIGGVDNLARSLRKASIVERTRLERMTTFLATTGSTGPFIGLFGTVWGILRAFQKIGYTGQATIQTVGPDIAHALIATAAGLVAAIPAVMAYNYFNSRIRGLNDEMDTFSSDFLNIVKRHFRGA